MCKQEKLLISGKVTRFLFSKNDFGGGRVKHSGFVPSPCSPTELSVCQTNNIEESEIWDVGFNSTRPNQKAKARGDMNVEDISEVKDTNGGLLCVFIDKIPHEYHCNIKVIPSEKAQMRAVATELAQISSLALPISSG